MDLATGAIGDLLPKLVELLKGEYKLKENVREGVVSLSREMRSMHAALRKVAEVPRDRLDEQVKLWAGEVRELSFDMEDVVDKFLVRVDDGSKPAPNSKKLKQLTKMMVGLLAKGKAHHEIIDAIGQINKQVQVVANMNGRYPVDNIVSTSAAVVPIDPRLGALYTEVTELVGIAGKRDQDLMKLLSEGDNVSKKKLKIISVVGSGGLGKTTLVKMVYDKIKEDFDCSAFVPVGRNADAKKILLKILCDLDTYVGLITMLDVRQLISKLKETLENTRYLIVIDDIRDEKLWKIIKGAFSNSNNCGSRLIMTTRIVSVAKLCCSCADGSIYQMEPLSDDDSKRLFYKRIFSHESGFPLEFEEVSIDILKKCGGVPLAIITIAGILVINHHVKPKDEWHVLLDSIGRGLTKDPSVEDMLRILTLSYYDMPSHLKTCFLYLSMFPEYHYITKDQLIWMWIAESFIQCEDPQTSLFEIGENYFNELVNRSLIQPEYFDGFVIACRVHNSVHDLICSLSSEENFTTILNDTRDSISSKRKVRRLSLQNSIKEEHQNTHLKFARSIATFDDVDIGFMPHFSRFLFLRVLDLTECDVSDHNHLNIRELWSLLQLRYLGLYKSGISEVPEEVGKLQFLQVLDLRGNYDITELPLAITKLRRLMCLQIDSSCSRIPDGIGNLISMENLSSICGDCLGTVEDLGNMERLRNLNISFNVMSLELEQAFVESIGKLRNIQCVHIWFLGYHHYVFMDLLGRDWAPPQSLREFSAKFKLVFSKLPTWLRRNPSHLSQLSRLDIFVDEVRQEDLEFLGRLPALRDLSLETMRQNPLLIGADGFRCLTRLKLICNWAGRIVFKPEALPKTEHVDILIYFRAANGRDWFELGLENLQSLRMVIVQIRLSPGVISSDTGAEQGKATLENTLHAHPNCPKVYVSIYAEPSGCHY
ncbi:Disease resistance RPP13-like protein 4 [Triticum urartu]|uniref:Disease resistance RPP13-like protein 4 n=3 Tax=Triticum urartu TaxID=4572 RepID=M7YI16_TRIUA|nr:disease resistance protein RGA5-like [Triticum urartu]XP_048554130.1 disease resistance protein RGA5-like [Triticum urartu]EMS50028.1 Disease resistance RPP13-like protein 4 [Triticum urartu]